MDETGTGDFFQAFVRLRSRSSGEWVAPPELRERLVADAEERESNLTDVVIAHLASRYGLVFEPAGRRTAPNRNGEELNLRLPIRLKMAIGAAANLAGCTLQRQIIEDLCAHYALELPEPARRRVAAA